MKIEILGLRDERTAALEVSLREALARTGLGAAAEVSRVEDMTAMIACQWSGTMIAMASTSERPSTSRKSA